jgi:hypothetical protein
MHADICVLAPRLNFVVQHLLGLKEALIGCFVAMSSFHTASVLHLVCESAVLTFDEIPPSSHSHAPPRQPSLILFSLGV